DQPYIAHGEGGVLRGRFKGDDFRVDTRRKEDGSIVQPTLDGRRHIETVLRKAGRAPGDIEVSLQRFDAAPDNQLVPLASDLSGVRWRIDKLEPAYDGPLLSEQALLKMAFEFLALHLAGKATDAAPQLVDLRRCIWD